MNQHTIFSNNTVGDGNSISVSTKNNNNVVDDDNQDDDNPSKSVDDGNTEQETSPASAASEIKYIFKEIELHGDGEMEALLLPHNLIPAKVEKLTDDDFIKERLNFLPYLRGDNSYQEARTKHVTLNDEAIRSFRIILNNLRNRIMNIGGESEKVSPFGCHIEQRTRHWSL